MWFASFGPNVRRSGLAIWDEWDDAAADVCLHAAPPAWPPDNEMTIE
jgi:hypothetical protein